MAHSNSTTGYYAGVLTCALMTGRTISSPFWGWLTDVWGRKPVLLCGLFFTMVISIIFGFSVNYPMAVLLRFALGLLAPIGVVTKTCVSEVCPESKQAQGMSFYSMIWLISSVIGSVIGGVLSDPKSSGIASSGVLVDYPVLLPNLITALCSLISLVGVFFWLDETLLKKTAEVRKTLLAAKALPDRAPLTYRDLLKDRVILLAVALYGLNSFCSTAYFELFPLWCWANKSNGGLHFEPLEIGYALAASNAILVIVQQWMFRKMVAAKGYRWNTVCGSLAMVPSIFVIPWISYSSNVYGIWVYIIGTSMIWYFLSFQVLTAQFVMTNNTVVKTERGKLNGICMMVGSFARALAPLCMGILYALTNVSGLPFPFNYTFCFNLIAFLCFIMWFFSRYLPLSIQRPKEAILKEEREAELKTARGTVRNSAADAARASVRKSKIGNIRATVRTSIITDTGFYHEDEDVSSDEEDETQAPINSSVGAK